MKRTELIVASATLVLIAYTLTLSVVGVALSSLQTSRVLSNTGTVKAIGVGVYSEYACINPVTSINWGTLEPGQTVNKTVYIKNTSNVPVTLSMITQNWNPASASNYITCTWNSEGKSLNANQVTAAVLTLSVRNNITGVTDFSFDIVIIGSG
ncbi:MAG: hypothetical protein ACUVRA_05085 [Candidatus Bathyarchaeaceae archaeon]